MNYLSASAASAGLSTKHMMLLSKVRLLNEETWLPDLKCSLSHEWLYAGRFQVHATKADKANPPKVLFKYEVCVAFALVFLDFD